MTLCFCFPLFTVIIATRKRSEGTRNVTEMSDSLFGFICSVGVSSKHVGIAIDLRRLNFYIFLTLFMLRG